MNLEIISSNIEEALEELKNIRDKANANSMDEIEFQIKLQHVYHHLNVAWNIRHQETEKYKNMTEEDFEAWGKFPSDIK